MRNDFENMVATHSPAVVKDTVAAVGIMDFLTVQKNQPFSRRNTPNQSYIMLFTTASSADFSIIECIQVGKSKPPIKMPKEATG